MVEHRRHVQRQAVERIAGGGGAGAARPPQVDADHPVAAAEGGGRPGPGVVVEPEPGQQHHRPPAGARPVVLDVEPDPGLDLDGRGGHCPARTTWNSSRSGSRVMCQYSALVHGIVVTTRPRLLR
jgi:hypothetical protein